MTETETHCPYCALQCGMTLSVSQHGHVPVIDVRATDSPHNRGRMCLKGFSAPEVLQAEDRLRTPLMRDAQGVLRAATWEEALDRVASEVRRIGEQHGRDAVGVMGGGGLTNETAYGLGKFARVVLGTKNIDYNGRFCMAASAFALGRSLGLDRGLPFPVHDIPLADVIVLVGGNPAETMPPLMQYFEEHRERGGKLIVIDPRRTATAEFASQYVAITPGSDVALANGLLHLLIRAGGVDGEFVATRTKGFEVVRRVAARYWPDRVERITGVPVATLEAVAKALGSARSLCVLTARGVEQQSSGVDAVTAFINLSLALGQFRLPGAGFGTLTGQGNGQGAREHGQKADQLPGYRSISDPVARSWVAKAWGVPESELPRAGLPACELLDACGSSGGVRALLVMGCNPVVSAPRATRVESGLRALDLLVVADSFLSETAELADVVFPVTQWAEHDGTMTNLEGRVLRRRRAIVPPAGIKTDLEILADISRRLGREGMIEAEPERAFAELAKTSHGGKADYSGLDYERLDRNQALFWPVTADREQGTPRPLAAAFPTEDGRASFFPVEYEESAERVDGEFPYYLVTGRLLAHYQTGVQTHRAPSLQTLAPEPLVQIHPQVASTHGIAEGDWVTLTTRRGQCVMRATLTTGIRLDTLFVPFHWSGRARVNELTSELVDPFCKIPEFKRSAVAVMRMSPQIESEIVN